MKHLLHMSVHRDHCRPFSRVRIESCPLIPDVLLNVARITAISCCAPPAVHQVRYVGSGQDKPFWQSCHRQQRSNRIKNRVTRQVFGNNVRFTRRKRRSNARVPGVGNRRGFNFGAQHTAKQQLQRLACAARTPCAQSRMHRRDSGVSSFNAIEPIVPAYPIQQQRSNGRTTGIRKPGMPGDDLRRHPAPLLLAGNSCDKVWRSGRIRMEYHPRQVPGT